MSLEKIARFQASDPELIFLKKKNKSTSLLFTTITLSDGTELTVDASTDKVRPYLPLEMQRHAFDMPHN